MSLKTAKHHNILLCSSALRVAALALGLLPAAALAQQPARSGAPDSPQETAKLDREIVVTGTRITASGFKAPTPTTILDASSLNANAQPNVFTTIAQLPSLQGSTGTQVNTFSTSSGQQGLSSFSLRGVGAIRTLTLLDGQRVVGANVTGVPDISLFPQLLIQRVDVVNGGASASYGSDAVGGVVNFITDGHFKGLKGNVQGGITTYGDDAQYQVQLAGGTSFLQDRLHVVGSVEYSNEAGIGGGDFGTALANGRNWFTQTAQINRGVLNDGSPQYVVRDQAQSISFTKYGLITAGPLQGIAFDARGNPFQFQYGSGGVPLRDAAGTVSGCYPGFCLGGDLSGNVDAGRSLQSSIERLNTYGRIGLELDNRNEIYLTVNVGKVNTQNQPVNGMNKPGLTIQCANPFVPAMVQNACTNAGITSFRFGTSNAALGNTQVYTERRQYRFVLGGKGAFTLAGKDWKYDIYGEHGTNYSDIDVRNILLTSRFNQAIDAISLNGAIVCRDPVARANGCQPLNILGGQPSAASLSYVVPQYGPYQRTRQTQDVASISFSGSPVDLWAGPLSIAFGGEFRHEFYRVVADPYGAGFANTPAGGNYPADPVLVAGGNNWHAGNYKNGGGAYSVKEGFFEANLPVINSDAMGHANLNGAVRVTNYSTSGTVTAWKVGGTWDLPIDGLRLRGVTSRDVRAPNLSEMFAAPVTTTLPNFFDPFHNTTTLVIQSVVGNPNLKPEIARNTTFGVALANPSWLPGLNISFDYYKLKLNGVISSISANDMVQYCYQNVLPQTCNSFNLNNPVGGNYINVQPFNLASIKTEGFDIEASYRWRNPLGLPGNFTLRALATHVINYITDTGLPGTIPVDSAGSNLGNTPHWKWLAVQSYDNDKFSLMVQERWFSDGTFANNFVVCSAGTCPASTANNPTIDQNFMAGAFYLDAGGSVNVTKEITAYFKVDNVTNRSPARNYIFNNPALYDQIGRVFRAGVRFKY
ncbi:TonB-dependent receptor plug domain-containing protein [Novosphingobium sp. KACC 22771]|uniref:TonB-dependent receptor plug domain-containing protein n=1 Tax=Novosphingobium sp. KACC 22771 TaxID=3025670 RepID=UPI002365261A|nr:TonB-dependent receptor [Novosphingobium sp. KACC 22771]WDF75067.1 TonB-dependent receptor [Novosphingobium sp. KACC 22771]